MQRRNFGLGLFAISATVAGCSRNDGEPRPRRVQEEEPQRSRLQDLFNGPNENTTIRVNRYLWTASLETLNFLPVESADPFTGVIQFGFGRAPGSSRTVRATVLVQDPALDARSLKVSLQTRGGPASAEMTRAVENAILTRARQLRIRDGRL